MQQHELRTSNRVLSSLLAVAITALLLPGSAAADSLLIRTTDPANGEPLAGAFVMVGPAAGQPFAGNHGTTGSEGTILFDDPALTTPIMVTAGTVDRAYVTVTTAPADSVHLRLPLRAITAGVPPPVARVTGTTPGMPAVNNNGLLELGFVLPAFDVEALLGTGQMPFDTPIETVNLPVIGDVDLPGVLVIPTQTELLFFTFSKPNYAIDLADNTTQSLFCPAGRIPIEDLLNISGDLFEFLNALEITDFGVERDVPISNGAVINVGIDHSAHTPVTVHFSGVPSGDQISLFSGARISGPGGQGERYVLFDGSSQLINAGTVLSAASVVPSGDLGDAVDATIAMHADSSAIAASYMSAIIKRDGFIPPTTLTADSFFLVPAVLQNGTTISFSNPENPGVSPPPTWAAGVFALAGDSGDPTVVTGMHWQVLAPAADLGFTLPSLPPSAPPALPDPSSTPGDDRLELTLTATDNSGDARDVLLSVLGDATHFVLNTIDVEAPTTGISVAAGAAPVATGVLGNAYPDPARAASMARRAITVPIVPPSSGADEVQIYAADGRLLRRLAITATAGVEQLVEWDGRNANGRPVPAGVYFVRLAGAPGVAEKVVIAR